MLDHVRAVCLFAWAVLLHGPIAVLSAPSTLSVHPIQPARTITDCHRSSAQTPAEHLRVAECLAQAGQWNASEEHFRLARQSPETLTAATVGHAKALFHLNQPYDAMLELEDFLGKHPDSVPALQVQATLYSVVAGESSRALEIMERCSLLAPEDSGVWQYLGSLYLDKRRDEEALQCFERAVKLTPGDAQALSNVAYVYHKLGRADEARATFEQALKLLDRAAEPAIVWLTYGRALQEQRDWVESRSAYTEALKLDSNSSEAHYGRAVSNENLGDFIGATADALSAIEEHPVPRKDAYLLLIRVAKAQKDQAKAADYARELARIDAQEAKTKEDSRVLRDLLLKAEPLFMQGQYVQAAAAYEELVAVAPQFYEAYFALGMCYAHTGQWLKAEETFKKYLTLQPLSADGHASLGLVLSQTKRIAEAKSELERALEIDPGMLEARKGVARLHASTSDYSTAFDLMLKTPNPENEWDEDYYFLLINCAAAAGRPEEAVGFCQRGTSRFPDSDRLKKLCSSAQLKQVRAIWIN